MFDFIVCILANIFRIYLIDKFAVLFVGRETAERRKKFYIYAGFFVINTILFWYFHTAWLNVLCNLMGISIALRLYTKSIKTNIFITVSIFTICLGCDVAVNSLFIDYEDGRLYSQIYVALSVFLFFICELLAEKIITTRKNVEAVQNFSLIFIPVCSILMVMFLLYTHVCTETGIVIVGCGLLIINFFMLHLYNQLLHSITNKYEADYLKKQLQIYANQLDIIMKSEEKVKSLRHDMKHHLNEIRLLAGKGKTQEIEGYINSMEDFLQNPKEWVSSGNIEIDSILNYMLQKAEDELNEVKINVRLPKHMQHSFEINTLFGNLLENAIEAAKQTEEKSLEMHASFKNGVLRIRIQNSCREENVMSTIDKADRRLFLTTKAQRQNHGLGLKSVRNIVEQYNGAMEADVKDGFFNVNLILYMPRSKEAKQNNMTRAFNSNQNCPSNGERQIQTE